MKNPIKNKKLYLAMKVSAGEAQRGLEPPVKIKLPDRCAGLLMLFETKKAARDWWGKNVELVEIESVIKCEK
jgi:hypothetical protein